MGFSKVRDISNMTGWYLTVVKTGNNWIWLEMNWNTVLRMWSLWDFRSQVCHTHIMMTSLNGNIFRVTSPLYGEFTGQLWIPNTKASDAEIWYFDRRLNKRLSKQSIHRVPSHPLWRHCHVEACVGLGVHRFKSGQHGRTWRGYTVSTYRVADHDHGCDSQNYNMPWNGHWSISKY